VIEKECDESSGNWRLKRKISLDIDAPGWFKTLSGFRTADFFEESKFDKSTRVLTIVTTNISLSSKASLEDISTYSPHEENAEWCVFKQIGTCTLHLSIFGIESKLESYFIGLYSNRYDEARKLDLQMIDAILKKRQAAGPFDFTQWVKSLPVVDSEGNAISPDTNGNAHDAEDESDSKKLKKNKKKQKSKKEKKEKKGKEEVAENGSTTTVADSATKAADPE